MTIVQRNGTNYIYIYERGFDAYHDSVFNLQCWNSVHSSHGSLLMHKFGQFLVRKTFIHIELTFK